MAKPPALVRSSDGELRVDASFPTGRYTFSLRSRAGKLLRDLGYRPHEALPWDLFQALAIVGDVWLPNTADDFVDDLAAPRGPTWLDDDEARAVAEYLRGRQVGTRDRERLADVLDSSALGEWFSVEDFDSKSEWVEQTASLVSQAHIDGSGTDRRASATEDRSSATDERSSATSILHVGTATLGRENMGRAARAADYLDAFRQAIDIALERRVDAVLQTGRLFQNGSPDRETVSGLQDQLARLRDESIPFYLVSGPTELELRSTVVKSLETSGLLIPVDSGAVEVGDGVTLVGVGAESDLDTVESAQADRSAENSLLVACGDADLSTPSNLPRSFIDRLPTRPVAIVAGKRTDPVRNEHIGVPLLDPGSTEHVLSKSTFDEDPPARGVDEYTITDGDLTVTRHELDVRPFRTVEFEIDDSTTLDSIERAVSDVDLDGVAVLARLEGSGRGAGTPSSEAVQSLLADEAFCARVYDDRSIPDDADSMAQTATGDADPGDPAETPEGDPERLAETVHALAELTAEVEALEPGTVAELETDALADSYAVLSKAKSELEDLRTAARDELTARIDPDETVAGDFGAVETRTRRRRSLRDSETVEAVFRARDIPFERVTTETIDSEKVETVVDESDEKIADDDVFDVSETEYVHRREFDLEGGVDVGATTDDAESESEPERAPHKVYLGDGARIGGWTPVERSVVEDEIVPLVTENRGGAEDETISVNFSSGVSISGWSQVDATVVRAQLVPLVDEHRVS